MLEKLKQWARHVKREVGALYLAARDPRTPFWAKVVAVAVVAYALSPIDLIPDFIPVLGYLDDIVLVPLGIMLAVRLIPQNLMQGFRELANAQIALKKNWVAAGLILTCWVAAGLMFAMWYF
jgi:uncharacterized membrane protein YkvA (DUF1232 family)